MLIVTFFTFKTYFYYFCIVFFINCSDLQKQTVSFLLTIPKNKQCYFTWYLYKKNSSYLMFFLLYIKFKMILLVTSRISLNVSLWDLFLASYNSLKERRKVIIINLWKASLKPPSVCWKSVFPPVSNIDNYLATVLIIIIALQTTFYKTNFKGIVEMTNDSSYRNKCLTTFDFYRFT